MNARFNTKELKYNNDTGCFFPEISYIQPMKEFIKKVKVSKEPL